jgi:PLD-like domain
VSRPSSTQHARRGHLAAILAAALLLASAAPLAAADQIYFPAVDNVTNVLIQKINAETVRIDMSCWYLTEHAISIALINRFKAGVPVRLIGDRGSIFEIDPITKSEFYWLANQGLPIRLRFNPTWFPEIDHMKATVFVGQNLVSFGSANYTPFELAPASATNYKDESVLFSDDSAIVNAFKTRFDQLWNDTTPEPNSLVPQPPYFKDFHDACANEPTGNCSDFATRYPNPEPMIIDTARLEPNNPTPAGLIWGQGPEFNNRLVQEINNESTLVQFVIYRLTVDNITQALLNKWQSGVPVQLLIEPSEYMNRKWPEFWLTHANLDKLWAAGVPMKQRAHDGLTHMKTLVTSSYATNGSSNYASGWQRDDNYFIPKATKLSIYTAVKNRVTSMWNSATAFTAFQPQPPDPPTLASPPSGSTNVPTDVTLTWTAGAFAVSYDVYLGTSSGSLALVANVPAQLVNNPPSQYSWQSQGLPAGTTLFWKVVSRTNATAVNPSLIANSSIWSFTTAGGTSGPPAAPTNPSPTTGATGVSTNPTLTWSTGAPGTTFNVAFGTSSPPPQVATGLSSPAFAPGSLSTNTTYFWRVTAVSSGGTTAGAIWSFTTGGGGGASDIVIYASDIPAGSVHGAWFTASDSGAAAGLVLMTADIGVAHADAPLASPDDFVDVTFAAPAGTTYRIWLRLRATANAKANDAVWVQFSDARASGSPIYPLNTTSGLLVNLATDGTGGSLNGFGWQNGAYWLSQPTAITFATGGNHTMRIQVREDGAQFDQIVLSPSTYLNSAPGSVTNDHTIVPKSGPPPPPQPPSAPSNPNPAGGATGVGVATTLTWSSSGATSYDVLFGTSNPPPVVSSDQPAASYNASGLVANTTYFWRIVARNSAGTTTGPTWSFTTAAAPPNDIVIYASDVSAGNRHGAWTTAGSPASPNGIALTTPDLGVSVANAPDPTPADFVDATFFAPAGVTYRIWLRIRALNNSKYNDAVWVQFSDAASGGSPIYALGSASGLLVNLATDSGATSLNQWGWANSAYWLSQQTALSFTSTGTHTIRIQTREDGAFVDQIVLSPATYFNAAPGGPTNDSTIVPKP